MSLWTKPQISWAVYNTADEAYVAAAYALKHLIPLGYFIGGKGWTTRRRGTYRLWVDLIDLT